MIDIGRPVVKKTRGDPGHRDIRESKKGGREVTSNKNLKARCVKPQRDYGTSNAVSPWHSTSKELTPEIQAALVLSKVLRSGAL